MRRAIFIGIGLALVASSVWGQPPKKKNTRAKPPQFDPKLMEGVFFADVKKQLQGDPPKAGEVRSTTGSTQPAPDNNSPASAGPAGGNAWPKLISASSIEDLVKGSKLRLDGAVTSAAKFAGGGFKDARREYTMLSILFAIIEQYPTQVRWKNSAPVVRTHMVRVAAGTKVGSTQAFNEAKLRLAELSDLIGGATVTDKIPIEEMAWSDAVDRVPAMQILEWGLRENLLKHCASPKAFEENTEEIVKFAELIATVGEVLNQKGMNDADDAEYVKMSKAMIAQAQAVLQATKLNSADGAREASALLDQSCDKCHNAYR